MSNVIPFPSGKSAKEKRVDALCEAMKRGPHDVVRHFATNGGVILIVGEAEVWLPAIVFEGLLSEMTKTCERAKRQ